MLKLKGSILQSISKILERTQTTSKTLVSVNKTLEDTKTRESVSEILERTQTTSKTLVSVGETLEDAEI